MPSEIHNIWTTDPSHWWRDNDKSNNREAVDAIISEDPFHINDIANYQIVEFTPTMFCNEELKTIL